MKEQETTVVKKSWFQTAKEVLNRAFETGVLQVGFGLSHLAAYALTKDPFLLKMGILWTGLGGLHAAEYFLVRPKLREIRARRAEQGGPKDGPG